MNVCYPFAQFFLLYFFGRFFLFKIDFLISCIFFQFKVLQHGFWSRIDFKRDNLEHNEATRPHVSSSNPWIQHFRNGNHHGATESPSPQEKLSLTATSHQFQQTSSSDTGVSMLVKFICIFIPSVLLCKVSMHACVPLTLFNEGRVTIGPIFGKSVTFELVLLSI